LKKEAKTFRLLGFGLIGRAITAGKPQRRFV
jgi:hypothetical protein